MERDLEIKHLDLVQVRAKDDEVKCFHSQKEKLVSEPSGAWCFVFVLASPNRWEQIRINLECNPCIGEEIPSLVISAGEKHERTHRFVKMQRKRKTKQIAKSRMCETTGSPEQYPIPIHSPFHQRQPLFEETLDSTEKRRGVLGRRCRWSRRP